jgi:hypothetical protein
VPWLTPGQWLRPLAGLRKSDAKCLPTAATSFKRCLTICPWESPPCPSHAWAGQHEPSFPIVEASPPPIGVLGGANRSTTIGGSRGDLHQKLVRFRPFRARTCFSMHETGLAHGLQLT